MHFAMLSEYHDSAGQQLQASTQPCANGGAEKPNWPSDVGHSQYVEDSVACQENMGDEESEATEQHESDQLTCIACGAGIQLLLSAAAYSSVDQVICLQVQSAPVVQNHMAGSWD